GLTDERATGHRISATLSAATGTAFVVSGLIAWRRRPDNRMGFQMVVLGFWWLVFRILQFSHTSLVYTVALFCNDAFVVLLVPFLVAFPSGRLVSRTGALLTAPFAVAVIPLELAWLFFLETGPPGNAFLISANADVASAIDTAQRILLASGSF